MDLSADWLLVSLLWGTLGTGLFLYGKKQARLPQLLAGLGLMGCPYFVPSPLWMGALGGGILVLLWLAVRAGV